MAGTITITGLSASEPFGERVIGPMTVTGTQVIGVTRADALASGDNTFVVPTGAVAALIAAPTNGAATLKIRTNVNSTDAGLTINGTGAPFFYPFPLTAPTSLIINSSASQTAPLNILFI